MSVPKPDEALTCHNGTCDVVFSSVALKNVVIQMVQIQFAIGVFFFVVKQNQKYEKNP